MKGNSGSFRRSDDVIEEAPGALPSVTEQVASWAAEQFRLTPREQQVLQGLLEGESNKSLAQRFGCSKRTAEAHITSALLKSGAQSRLELVSRCWMLWAEGNR